MKKLFLIFALLLFIFPSKVLSQSPGKAGCAAEPIIGGPGGIRCRGKDSQCNSGFQANDEYCQQFDSSKETCLAATPVECVDPLDPGATRLNTSITDCKDPGGERGINTAIGCIPIGNTNDFIAFILRWAIGIGGGIAFLLILFGGFQIMTSNGVPEKVQAGKELITSAITGLVMLIFSVFILRFIGVDILQLPGFVPK